MRFSEFFRLKRSQGELDFVDVKLDDDTPLFLDPYALTTREDEWSEECHALIVSYFQALIEAVSTGRRTRGIELLSHLSEPEETRLGVSQGHSKGRGIGVHQSGDLFDAMSRSKAARTGLLEDLSDFALFVPGIGPDKISDMTTNIIRRPLIEYTQNQAGLHGVPLRRVASGFFWTGSKWAQEYVDLPVCNQKKVILVPKFAVRYQVGVDASKYRSQFVLEFLQAEHLRLDDGLVTIIRDKKTGKIRSRKVLKRDVDAKYPTDKDFLAEFSRAHPEVIDGYRDALKEQGSKIPNLMAKPSAKTAAKGPTESDLAEHLKRVLLNIPAGAAHADDYHTAMIGIVSFLFFPNLIYPKKELPLAEGRKRMDIKYTNGKESGIFFRLALDAGVKANVIHVECKNYTTEIANAEFDQLIGRFDMRRGKVGMLLYRSAEKKDKVLARARDAAVSHGCVILPLDDAFIVSALDLVKGKARATIDQRLDAMYTELLS